MEPFSVILVASLIIWAGNAPQGGEPDWRVFVCEVAVVSLGLAAGLVFFG